MASTAAAAGDTNPIEHVDVLIVGAGISGIGSAWHLQEQCPDKSYLILEAKETFGGTWETHKYPGVRSDSDLYTFGYRFKPWVGAPVASGAEILKYLGEVVDENGIGPHICYGHRITGCRWPISTLITPSISAYTFADSMNGLAFSLFSRSCRLMLAMLRPTNWCLCTFRI